MDDIFYFSPKAELDAKLNLEQFIQECKTKLTVFGTDLDWTNWKWYRAGHFTKLGAHSRSNNAKDVLNENFIEFAKAYFRYQQGHNPTGTKNELKALRTVESALLQFTGDAHIQSISVSVLDEAALLMRLHYSGGAAYHGGRELERLAKFITHRKLISADLSYWRSPIPRKRDEIQTGEIAKQRRDKKMPSDVALNALAEIFANNPSELKDIFTSSTFALLMSAPSRITEVLELPVNCEVEERDSKGVLRYGLRFYAGKGYGADIKWIPTEMVGIAKEAIRRITKMTEEPRRLAKWIENNPNKFYRHVACPNMPDDSLLNALQATYALGLAAENKHAAQASLHRMKLKNKDFSYTLDSLWQYVVSRQPVGFPWLNKEKKIKYSNALFCMTRNLIGTQRGTSPVILWAPANNVFNNDLSPRLSLQSNHQSIFDRNGYLTQDNQRIKLTSHQARHLLNTMAQRGGLSQMEIAKWSGRADSKQNRTYNHMSEFEKVARAESLNSSLTLFGPSGEMEMSLPVTIQEFNTLEKGAVHITEFGFCVRDYTISPCDKYRDCLNCNEQVCIKGDIKTLPLIKRRMAMVQEQFNAADKALEEGYAGTDRWYEYHKNTLEHLNQLVAILEDPAVEDGAQIKLRNSKAFSPLRRAVETKLSDVKDPKVIFILKALKKKL